MKVEGVPQDSGACYEGHLRACYAVDEHGKYVIVPSIGWDAEIAVTELAFARTAARIAQVKEDVREGRASPLAYHLALRQMDVGLIAGTVGLWKWRVRRHLKPKVFAGLSEATKLRYCQAFEISLEELNNV